MTGMPSFGAIEVPDQEIWTIVAFVKKLPSVSDEDFRTWSELLKLVRHPLRPRGDAMDMHGWLL